MWLIFISLQVKKVTVKVINDDRQRFISNFINMFLVKNINCLIFLIQNKL